MSYSAHANFFQPRGVAETAHRTFHDVVLPVLVFLLVLLGDYHGSVDFNNNNGST